MNFEAKIQTKTIKALLLGLLVFSTVSLISVNTVSAYVGSAVFLPNYFYDPPDTEDELELAEETCTYIRGMLANRYATGTYYAFNDDCTVSAYCSILSTLDNSGIIDEIVVFSKGHRGYPFLGYPWYNDNHISLLDHYGSALLDDPHIYDRTSSKNTFTFIWHCETAEKYPEGATEDEIGYYGMPYCWTHNEDLDDYGGDGNVAFLGWVDGSPQFEYQAEGMWNYAHVAYLFWYYMCDGEDVEGALNEIADVVFGDDNYLSCPLSSLPAPRLLLWGDKTMELPED